MADAVEILRMGATVASPIVFLVAGVWLCIVRPLSARHAGLGHFLLMSAFVSVFALVNVWAFGRGDLGLTLAARRAQQLATLGADLAIIVFIFHYPRVRWPLRRRIALSRTVIALAFGLFFLVALVPSIYRRSTLVGGEIVERDGPLVALVNFPTFIVIAATLVHDYLRAPRGERRRSLLLVSLGLLLYRIPVTVLEAANWDPGVTPRGILAWRPIIGAAALLFILGRLAWAVARPPVDSKGPARMLVLTIALCGIGLLWVYAPDVAAFALLAQFGTLAFGILAIYGILRGEILDLDAKVHVGVRRSTVAAAILAGYFIVAESVQSYFSEIAGVAAGGVAAGALLLASMPLQRFAERVASTAAPARPVAAMPEEARLDLYRDAARDAWADGVLGQGERRVLEGLRAKLAISAEDALRIEAQAAEDARTTA